MDRIIGASVIKTYLVEFCGRKAVTNRWGYCWLSRRKFYLGDVALRFYHLAEGCLKVEFPYLGALWSISLWPWHCPQWLVIQRITLSWQCSPMPGIIVCLYQWDNSEVKLVPAFHLGTSNRFLSSLLLLRMPCPEVMIESPHQYLPIQNWVQSMWWIMGIAESRRLMVLVCVPSFLWGPLLSVVRFLCCLTCSITWWCWFVILFSTIFAPIPTIGRTIGVTSSQLPATTVFTMPTTVTSAALGHCNQSLRYSEGSEQTHSIPHGSHFVLLHQTTLSWFSWIGRPSVNNLMTTMILSEA